MVHEPDLLIYLKSSVPTLVSQIQKRGRDYEKSISIEYLSNLNERYDEYVIRAFKGIRPVVAALIGVPMLTMLKATKMKWWSWLIWIGSMTLVCVMKVSPIYILICVIAGAIFISWHNNKRKGSRSGRE